MTACTSVNKCLNVIQWICFFFQPQREREREREHNLLYRLPCSLFSTLGTVFFWFFLPKVQCLHCFAKHDMHICYFLNNFQIFCFVSLWSFSFSSCNDNSKRENNNILNGPWSLQLELKVKTSSTSHVLISRNRTTWRI